MTVLTKGSVKLRWRGGEHEGALYCKAWSALLLDILASSRRNPHCISNSISVRNSISVSISVSNTFHAARNKQLRGIISDGVLLGLKTVCESVPVKQHAMDKFLQIP